LKLRAVQRTDASAITKLLRDREVSRWTANIPYPYRIQDAIDWIELKHAKPMQTNYAIDVGDELVGVISFWSAGGNNLEIGYWLGRPYWGKGYGTKAVSLLLQQPDLPAHRAIFARVMKDNTGSERVLTNNGFSPAGDTACNRLGDEVDATLFTRKAVSS